jgi:hypothetical protein
VTTDVKQPIDYEATVKHLDSLEDPRRIRLLEANRAYKAAMIAALEAASPYIERFGVSTRPARRLKKRAKQLLDHMARYRFADDTPKARRISDKHLLWATECALEVTQLYRRVRAQYIAGFKGQRIPDVPREIGLPDLVSSGIKQTLSIPGLGSLDEEHLRADVHDPSQTRVSKQGRDYREQRPPRPRLKRRGADS